MEPISSHTIKSFNFSFHPIWGVCNGMRLHNSKLLFYPCLHYIVSYISQIHLLHISFFKIILYVYVFFLRKLMLFSEMFLSKHGFVFPLVHSTRILSQIYLVDEQSYEACWVDNSIILDISLILIFFLVDTKINTLCICLFSYIVYFTNSQIL